MRNLPWKCSWRQVQILPDAFHLYIIGFSSLSIYSLNLFRKGGHRICRMVAVSISVGVATVVVMNSCASVKRKPTPLGAKFGTVIISRSMRLSYGLTENMVIVFSPCCEIKKALRFLCNRRAIDSITYSVVVLIPVQRSAARLQERGIRP